MAIVQLEACAVDLETGQVDGHDTTRMLKPQLLELLRWWVERPHETLHRDVLHREVWDYSAKVVSRAADVAISRLRHALEADPTHPRHFLSVRGKGYRYEPLAGARPVSETVWPAAPPLWGRQADQDHLRTRLSPGITTLVGPPGVGKTALMQSMEIFEETPATRWFVALDEVRDLQGLLAMVATVVGPSVLDDGFGPLGRVLLVLDGVDRMVGPCAAQVLAWVQQARELTVCVTSRERLNLGVERLVRVDPLDDADSVRMLEALTGDSGPELTALAGRLDGLPLALRLAAGRCSVLSPARLLQRLEGNLGLLSSGRRDLPANRQALWATMEISWGPLSPVERRVLAACALGEGPIQVEVVEAVLSDSLDGELPFDVLARLVDRSLVQPRQGANPPRVLSVVRAFVRSKLNRADHLRMWRRYAEEILVRTEPATQGAIGHPDGMALDVAPFARDLLAVERTLPREPEAYRATAALAPWRANHTAPDDHLVHVEHALEHADGPLEARLRCIRAYLLLDAGRFGEAQAELETVLDGGVHAWQLCARMLQLRARLDVGERSFTPDFEALVDALVEAGQSRWELEARVQWSRMERLSGRADASRAQSRALAARARSMGSRSYEAISELEWARTAAWEGDLEGAIQACTRALQSMEDPHNRWAAHTLELRGRMYAKQGRPLQALEDYEEALGRSGRIDGRRRWAARLRGHHALPNSQLGRWDEARRAVEDCAAMALELDDENLQRACHVNLALVLLAEGELMASLEHFKVAQDSASPDPVLLGYTFAYHAVALAELGRLGEARRLHARAREMADLSRYALLVTAVSLVGDYLSALEHPERVADVVDRLERTMAEEPDMGIVGRIMLRGLGEPVGGLQQEEPSQEKFCEPRL